MFLWIKIVIFANMFKPNKILSLLLIIILLSGRNYAFGETIEYKNSGCKLKYNKIDGYNVEVGIQGDNLKNDKIYIPNEIHINDTTYYVIGIGDNAFSGNKYIKEIRFAEESDIKYIGEGAFAGCENLTDIELPSTITEIKPYTFAWCGLKYIEIHNFIKKIGERAFTNCKKLSQIEMSENVEEIGNYAFAWCPSLTSFTIPIKTKILGYEILQANKDLDTLYFNAINCETSGAYYDERIDRTIGAFESNKGLSEVIFGYQVEQIPEYLLYNCTLIDSLYFPKSIKKIERFALHNTEWFYSTNSDFVYVNDILYSYKGNELNINAELFKENTIAISDNCFQSKKIEKIQIPNTITYIGKSAFEDCQNLEIIRLPYDLEEIDDYGFKNCKSLKHLYFNNQLVHIGKYCFSGCSNLQQINLPATLTNMGEGAFYNCTDLTSANIPNKTTIVPAGCFSNCPNLERVSLHNNILRIEEYAFAGCSRLDSIHIPWNCEVIGSRAFSHCRDLQQIKITTKSARIDPLAFYKCRNITELNLMGVNRIGYKAFAQCEQLKNLILDNELKIISTHAFEDCNSLSSLFIPQSVTLIGKFAFSRCKNITSIEISNAHVNIDDNAFCYCSGLVNVSLGENIERLGKYVFRGCRNLESISILNSIDKIETGSFYDCSKLSTINIPEGVNNIEDKAFAHCSALTNVTIPSSIISIKEKAFFDCYTLKTINFPERINDIGKQAFYGCNELKSIEIPVYLKKIGENAFGGCNNLTNIKFNAENCKAGKNVFTYTIDVTDLYIGNTVQTIDDHIFEGMNLESISIPNNITKIGKMAFANSYPLDDINISSLGNLEIDNTAFENTYWEKRQVDDIVYLNNIAFKYIGEKMPDFIKIKEGTTDIASNFMKNNDHLKHVVLPQSLRSIGAHAFENCYNLEYIDFPNSLLIIHQNAFAGCINLKKLKLPPYLSKIGNFAFENCTKVDSLFIDNAYCSIGIASFRNCKQLKHAYLGDNITNIEDMAFAFCSKLKGINSNKEVILPSKLKTINYATFYKCEKLNGKIVLPSDITTIRDKAFEDCRSLISITLSENIDSISCSAFDGAYNFTRYFGKLNNTFSVFDGILYSKNKFTLYHCPEGYRKTCVIHKDATNIYIKAFNNCTRIEHIILNNVNKIEDYAFNGCTNLRKVTIGNNTQHIGIRIFEGCQSLLNIDVKKGNIYYKSINGVLYSNDMKTLIYCPKAKKGIFKIPKSVLHISDYAFYDCNQLEKVILHKNIISIGKEAFTGCKFENK